MKDFYKVIISRSLFVMVVFIFLLAISFGSVETSKNYVANINGVKSIEAAKIVAKNNLVTIPQELKVFTTVDEVSLYASQMPVAFIGQMTAYKATCPGCTGRVSCPPRQNVLSNNIYFEDSVYGTVRILAADSKIPCGTIISVSNLTFSTEPIIGIVLDRGKAIEGTIIDFLVKQEDDMNVVGRQMNVQYQVLRWGW